MVQSIEAAVDQVKKRQRLIAQSLVARQTVTQTGMVVDGHAFGEYIKAKVRGQSVKRPKTQGIKNFANAAK